MQEKHHNKTLHEVNPTNVEGPEEERIASSNESEWEEVSAKYTDQDEQAEGLDEDAYESCRGRTWSS